VGDALSAAGDAPLPTVWKTRDGDAYFIDTMDGGHLLNCVWYLLRKSEDVQRVRGVNYFMSYNAGKWRIRDDPAYRMFLSLVLEAEQRGLDWLLATHWQPPITTFWHRTNETILELPLDCPGVKRHGRPLCFGPRGRDRVAALKREANPEHAQAPGEDRRSADG
jgi:hypothetical protein